MELEKVVQAAANGLLMLTFFTIAIEQYRLYSILSTEKNPTDLGKAMSKKYLAWSVASVLLGALQAYSLYFNLTGEVGIFTFEVRNALRILAVVGLVLAYRNMREMRLELDRAENTMLKGDGHEYERA